MSIIETKYYILIVVAHSPQSHPYWKNYPFSRLQRLTCKTKHLMHASGCAISHLWQKCNRIVTNKPAGPNKSSSFLKLKHGVMKNIKCGSFPENTQSLPSLAWSVLREWPQKTENTFFFFSFFFLNEASCWAAWQRFKTVSISLNEQGKPIKCNLLKALKSGPKACAVHFNCERFSLGNVKCCVLSDSHHLSIDKTAVAVTLKGNYRWDMVKTNMLHKRGQQTSQSIHPDIQAPQSNQPIHPWISTSA